MNVGIYLFDQIEVLDFAGPFEVFSTAARVWSRLRTAEPAPFETFTVGESGRPIVARGGLNVVPRYRFGEHPQIDVLVVPGGIVTEEVAKPQVVGWIRAIAETTQITASVCTGAFLLAKAGLLKDKDAVTHWEDLDDLRSAFPEVRVRGDRRWIDTGAVVSSAGISAGIDMALHLVERLAARDLAVRTARQMDYRWADAVSHE